VQQLSRVCDLLLLAKFLPLMSLSSIFYTAADENATIPPANSEGAWNAFVENLNRSLDPLNLEFRQIRDEEHDTERILFGLVSLGKV
jgi:hypothetical protein